MSAKCVYAFKCMYAYVKDCMYVCLFSLLADVCCTQTTRLTIPRANYRRSLQILGEGGVREVEEGREEEEEQEEEGEERGGKEEKWEEGRRKTRE